MNTDGIGIPTISVKISVHQWFQSSAFSAPPRETNSGTKKAVGVSHGLESLVWAEPQMPALLSSGIRML